MNDAINNHLTRWLDGKKTYLTAVAILTCSQSRNG